ncbi:MAG TPA: hypothetical protein VFC44_05245 [Candidatus Saccharimonadales bacterium]|nr:hypothetical protein [Candidatus Saccharimonadales bacterium]
MERKTVTGHFKTSQSGRINTKIKPYEAEVNSDGSPCRRRDRGSHPQWDRMGLMTPV